MQIDSIPNSPTTLEVEMHDSIPNSDSTLLEVEMNDGIPDTLEVQMTAPGTPAGPGFLNVGNTCFLNAVLQSLIHLPALLDNLVDINSHYDFSCDLSQSGKWCALCSLQDLVSRKNGSEGIEEAYEPSSFTRHFTEYATSFQLGQQEDAHEFLGLLLNALQNSELGHDAMAFNQASETELGGTIVGLLFEGKLRSEVWCSGCSMKSYRHENFRNIAVPLTEPTVKEALHGMYEMELLIDDCMYMCERCNGLRLAIKNTELFVAPPILTLNINRFSATGEKINTSIVASPVLYFVSAVDGAKMEYSLQATISHIGSTTDSGHYYTHIKASDGLWYRINDEEVDLVDEFDVVNNYSTYLLFYVVTDAHWTPSYFLNGPEVPVV